MTTRVNPTIYRSILLSIAVTLTTVSLVSSAPISAQMSNKNTSSSGSSSMTTLQNNPASMSNNIITGAGSNNNISSMMMHNLGTTPLFISHYKVTNVASVSKTLTKESAKGNSTIMLPSGNVSTHD
jgi:hypothetical protein